MLFAVLALCGPLPPDLGWVGPVTRPGRIRSLWDRLVAAVTVPTPCTAPTEENPMHDTDTAPSGDAPGVPTADRIAAVDAELAALDAQAAADPVTADDVNLDRWRARDAARRDRSAQLVQRRRDLREFGRLLDDHGQAIRGYLGAAGAIRHQLAQVAEERHYRGRDTPRDKDARRDLTTWCRALEALGRALPRADDDARRYLAGQWTLWYRARDGYALAMLALTGRGELPSPETGRDAELPAGLVHGVVLADDPQHEGPRHEPAQVRVLSVEEAARIDAGDTPRLRPGALRS